MIQWTSWTSFTVEFLKKKTQTPWMCVCERQRWGEKALKFTGPPLARARPVKHVCSERPWIFFRVIEPRPPTRRRPLDGRWDVILNHWGFSAMLLKACQIFWIIGPLQSFKVFVIYTILPSNFPALQMKLPLSPYVLVNWETLGSTARIEHSTCPRHVRDMSCQEQW